MAIGIRSETSGGTTTNASDGTFVVNKPSTVADNDYLVVIIGKQDEPEIAGPDGSWTAVQAGSATGNDRYAGIFYHKVTNAAGEPATYTFDSAGTSEQVGWWIGSVSGIDGTTPQDVTFVNPSALANDTSPATPAVTTATNGAMAFAVWAVNTDPTSTMPGGNWIDRAVNVGGNGVLSVASQIFPTAGTSTGTPELTNVASGMESMVGMFVFRPGATTSSSVSPSLSPSYSVSPSLSQSFSESPSFSVSPSLSQSYSLSESFSVSPSISPSYSVSPSISQSYSVSPSVSPSFSVSPSLSPSYSVSPSISESYSVSPSISPSYSVSPSISQSFSLSESISVSPSLSQSYSVSPSVSPSFSLSESFSVSPSISQSYSISPSISQSFSLSPSFSISPSISPSFSVSPSISPSFSVSVSESISASVSESPSVSLSLSESFSVSPSISESASVSPSVGAIIQGTVCWGHSTGVEEDNTRTFASNWTGTGSVINAGDNEQLVLESQNIMTSELVNTGVGLMEIIQNKYLSGDSGAIEYRTGATAEDCQVADWLSYTVPFSSLGYVQLRVSN